MRNKLLRILAHQLLSCKINILSKLHSLFATFSLLIHSESLFTQIMKRYLVTQKMKKLFQRRHYLFIYTIPKFKMPLKFLQQTMEMLPNCIYTIQNSKMFTIHGRFMDLMKSILVHLMDINLIKTRKGLHLIVMVYQRAIEN